MRPIEMSHWKRRGSPIRNPRSRWRSSRVTRGGVALMAWLVAPLSALAQDNVVATATLPRDLSPWGMYLNADPVEKAVLIILVVASVVTWTVWLAKSIEIFYAKRGLRAALNKLAGVGSVFEGVGRLADSGGEVEQFLDAAATELKASASFPDSEGTKERIASRLERIEASYGRRPRHRRARHDRGNRPLRRVVRNSLGHHEQLHRHLEGAYHQSCGGRARHRRGVAGDRARARGCDSGGGDLQRLRALDRRLSRRPWRCRGGGAAPRQPRSRARCWRTPRGARGRARCRSSRGTGRCERSTTRIIMSVRLDHGGDTLDEVHEINVTPFIDVILVLLI